MINRCIGCYHHDSKENVCTHGSPIFLDDICTDYQDNEFVKQIRADERKKAEQDFQNSDYWNEYLAKVIADTRADEREKMIDEADAIIDFIKNNSFDHNLEFDSLRVIGSSVVISLLEQLKEQKNVGR